MADLDDVWIPLVDEPIGSIVARIQAETPEIRPLVDSPRRMLAFRTFAYIRVGIVLGQLLVEDDLDEYDGSETWIESLLRNPAHHERVRREIVAVAEEIGADPSLAADEPMGPDEAARKRFLAFARERLGG